MPTISCSKCGAHFEGNMQGLCSEHRAERFAQICPPLYLETKWERLPVDQRCAAHAWTFGWKGLLLVGGTGLGKTRIAWSVIRTLLVDSPNPPPFRWFDCVSFGHELARHYNDGDAEDWLDRVSKTGLVFFDDLGKLKMTERAEAELFGVIERRCANMLPIIATTNDTGESLSARMTDNRGPAMIRRLREFCEVISF